MKKNVRLDAVGLFTKDMGAMVAFYRDVMGLSTNWKRGDKNADLYFENTRLIFYGRDDFEDMTGRHYGYPAGLNGTMEIAFEVPSFDDVDAEFERVTAAGAIPVFSPKDEPWGQRTCYVADPDGNLIEIGSFQKESRMLTDEPYFSRLKNTLFAELTPPASSLPVREQVRHFYLAHGKSRTLAHVLAVADTARKIAREWNLDEEKCIRAALYHDLAAVLSPEKMRAFIRDNDLYLDPAEDAHPFLLHQRFSAAIACAFFGETDAEILSAIRKHTTLDKKITPVMMAVFLADKLSWDRDNEPPYKDDVENALHESLEKACLTYIHSIYADGTLLYPHRWLVKAKETLESNP